MNIQQKIDGKPSSVIQQQQVGWPEKYNSNQVVWPVKYTVFQGMKSCFFVFCQCEYQASLTICILTLSKYQYSIPHLRIRMHGGTCSGIIPSVCFFLWSHLTALRWKQNRLPGHPGKGRDCHGIFLVEQQLHHINFYKEDSESSWKQRHGSRFQLMQQRYCHNACCFL